MEIRTADQVFEYARKFGISILQKGAFVSALYFDDDTNKYNLFWLNVEHEDEQHFPSFFNKTEDLARKILVGQTSRFVTTVIPTDIRYLICSEPIGEESREYHQKALREYADKLIASIRFYNPGNEA